MTVYLFSSLMLEPHLLQGNEVHAIHTHARQCSRHFAAATLVRSRTLVGLLLPVLVKSDFTLHIPIGSAALSCQMCLT